MKPMKIDLALCKGLMEGLLQEELREEVKHVLKSKVAGYVGWGATLLGVMAVARAGGEFTSASSLSASLLHHVHDLANSGLVEFCETIPDKLEDVGSETLSAIVLSVAGTHASHAIIHSVKEKCKKSSETKKAKIVGHFQHSLSDHGHTIYAAGHGHGWGH